MSIQQSRFFRGKAKEAKIRMTLKGGILICLALLGYLMTADPPAGSLTWRSVYQFSKVDSSGEKLKKQKSE
jgi:hypothetical protein